MIFRTLAAAIALLAPAAVLADDGSVRGATTDRELRPDGISCKKVFNFNMIAHNNPDQPSCDNEGNRIFIESGKTSRIEVYQYSGTFDIGCDQGNGGDKYALSVPDIGTFDVYVRALGKPDGQLDIEVCDRAEEDCFLDSFSIKREKGKSSFQVKTNDLFSDEYEDLLWKTTTNEDFKIAQFWFCER